MSEKFPPRVWVYLDEDDEFLDAYKNELRHLSGLEYLSLNEHLSIRADDQRRIVELEMRNEILEQNMKGIDQKVVDKIENLSIKSESLNALKAWVYWALKNPMDEDQESFAKAVNDLFSILGARTAQLDKANEALKGALV